MRYPSQLVSITLVWFLFPTVIAWSDEPLLDNVDIATISADELWTRVLARNKVWLDPTAENLSYIAKCTAENDNRVPEAISRVWVSGERVRWEMDRAKGVHGTEMSYVLVVRGEKQQYLKSHVEAMIGKPQKARDIRTMIQGITWTTAVHVLAKTGLPKHSSIVERRTVPGGHLVVLETDLGSVHRRVGLGFYHAYYGSMNAFLGQVRIHVKTPEFIPVKEEYPAGEIAPNERYPEGKAYPKREVVVEYDPVFIAIGDQVAPKTIRHIKNRGSREGSWILEAHFQRVNDQWLLEKAYNIQGGKRWARMVVSGVSTKPVDPKLFDVPEP